MKKLYTLSLLMAAGLSFGQTPIITGMIDGDCTGGNPKAIEIYADGTVDFSLFSIENQTNANTTWSNTLSLASFGTKTDTYIYVVNTDDSSYFSTEFAGVPTANILYTEAGTGLPQPLNINGDDRVRIINTATSVVIDQFGQEGVDGTGTPWEHLDSWAYRNDNTGPNGANFTVANWTFGGVAALDGLGTCQGGAAFSTLVPFGTYSPDVASVPTEDIAGLKLFPNPLTAGNTLNITSNNNADKAVAIFDILGKQIFNGTTLRGTVNTSNLTTGVYIVKITEGNETATRKLIVQ